MRDSDPQKGCTQRWCWLISVVTKTGEVPKKCKNANVIPSSKTSQNCPENYRLTSLILVFGKVTEQDFCKRKNVLVCLAKQLRWVKIGWMVGLEIVLIRYHGHSNRVNYRGPTCDPSCLTTLSVTWEE